MDQIIFKSREEAYEWIDDNLIQGDERYTAWTENQLILAQFFHEDACLIEEKEIMDMKEPSYDELREIGGPQEYHKFIAIKLLESNGFVKQKIKTEYPFLGRRVDIFARLGKKKILVECCSLDINKVIEYLEVPSTELWVITAGYAPWDKMFPIKDRSQWFIIKRGKNWAESYKKFLRYKRNLINQVKNPLDSLNIKKWEA
ncbi:hypothetical protein HYV88_03800 [Candidatus Woesearchaeota archaeon]|nr:hypothetical protein [Candidatus Woesearchaeota archaeon]